ncbi:hypothetical protein ABZT04_26335 [Streptomyces sp. NPDC005492]|uniref:DODA-type extradiol aromatic ring-opening family dioxygenase n=1 Tax=Streptomyces sp. NPDC005492 TaxID=3156883 RepID=UPI0033B9C46E
MARIVTGIGSSHGPQLKMTPDLWHVRGVADRKSTSLAFRGGTYTFAELAELREDFSAECAAEAQERRAASCQSALDGLGRHLEKADVDVLVIVSSDHKEVYDDALLPAFAVYWGDEVAHVPFTQAQLDVMPPGLAEAAFGDVPDQLIVRPTASALGRHLIEETVTAGFDTAASKRLPAGDYDNHGIPHGFGFIYQRILGETSTVPFVPVFVNTFYEPNPPTARRCVAFGEALAAAIASFPEDLKVGLVASGGLSHFVVDEELDQRFLTALRAGDTAALTEFTPEEMRSGSSELRNWITVAAALNATGLAVDSVRYEPCYRTEAGTGNAMGFVTWSTT